MGSNCEYLRQKKTLFHTINLKKTIIDRKVPSAKGTGKRSGPVFFKLGIGWKTTIFICCLVLALFCLLSISPAQNTAQAASAVVFKSDNGSDGGNGHDDSGLDAEGGNGDDGDDGGSFTLTNADDMETDATKRYGVWARSIGGDGGNGGDADGFCAEGGNGGDGGDGGDIIVENSGNIVTRQASAFGIFVESEGGDAGEGGEADGLDAEGGDGGGGGDGEEARVNNSGDIETHGDDSHAILAQSVGGSGGPGGDAGGIVANGGDGVSGGSGGWVEVVSSGTISTTGADAYGILGQSIGGGGGASGGGSGLVSLGSGGGEGADGGTTQIVNTGDISTSGVRSHGALAQSIGGGGGSAAGGNGLVAIGGDGSGSGDGGTASVYSSGLVSTQGEDSYGLFAQSIGGGGGSGGGGGGLVAIGGDAGSGGNGGFSKVTNDGTVNTTGARSFGLFSQSVGGGGGSCGGTGAGVAIGGQGGSGGSGGSAEIDNNGSVSTSGDDAHAIFSQSIGGGGGTGGASGGLVTLGGEGSSGANGGKAIIHNSGTVTTIGDRADGLRAQSVGGGGGSAGGSGAYIVNIGGSGDGGGNGDSVNVENQGTITTQGSESRGIFVQSVGGGGGDGGSGGSYLVNIGGSGAGGGNGAAVNVDNQGLITTSGEDASAILAQSIGGGGGDGGSGGAKISIGGTGAGGGDGGSVNISNSANINTSGERSKGIFAQSIGGGGGNGGGSGGEITVGGSGGGGGNGGDVNVASTAAITTAGGDASAILAQSVGGGGGNGGFAASGGTFSALAVGGSGGDGGDAGSVDVTSQGILSVSGDRSHGILAQSVGGGGGNGGQSVSGSAGLFGSVSVAVGGSGGSGGDSGSVKVTSNNTITTAGSQSYGILAQSIGGGGGTGGQSVSAAASAGKVSVSAAVSVGGDGGDGGDGSEVEVTSTEAIATSGLLSHAIFAQSVGGGGGSGGGSVAASAAAGVAAGSISLGLGGSGSTGGDGDKVTVNSSGTLTTTADGAHGLLAQSVGGGGGDGGFSTTGSTALGAKGAVSVGVSLGGSGADGGDGGEVVVTQDNSVQTEGDCANGILAQSVGGGGGNGGFSGAFGMALSSKTSGTLSLSLGGSGGSGGDGGKVQLTNNGQITTMGDSSYGLVAQSVGGGGGNGGTSVTAEASMGEMTANVGVSLGGSGGSGGSGGQVELTNTQSIATSGDQSYAILAQSVGGGGGTGGMTGSFAISNNDKSGANINIDLGGTGGDGGDGGDVTVTTTATTQASGLDVVASAATYLTTSGQNAVGILAQSIGGGGGTGGTSLGASLGASKSVNIVVSLGGSGGTGGTGGDVDVTSASVIATEGAEAHGILAQSVGGGGGTGGASGSITASKSESTNVSLSLGGTGGSGGSAGEVEVENSGTITTQGEAAMGILAQSIGGGGGTGGLAGFEKEAFGEYVWCDQGIPEGGGGAAAASYGSKTMNLSFALGGYGGTGNDGGSVTVINNGLIHTYDDTSHAILAQSVGGGGGTGGASLAATAALGASNSATMSVAVGGDGGTAGDGGTVSVTNNSSLIAEADGAYGILAQSVGGGGGDGGYAKGFTLQRKAAGGAGEKKGFELTATVGGSGGAGGDGGDVNVVNTGTITTLGHVAHAVMAQSIGGGGGNGGGTAIGSGTLGSVISDSNSNEYSLNVGGSGGASGDAGDVTVTNDGVITSTGDVSYGIFAQSVGGGGGNVGQGAAAAKGTLRVGGSGGAAGDGGRVTVTNNNTILTEGAFSYGIFAQSIGGGGGNGGMADLDATSRTRKELMNLYKVAKGRKALQDSDSGSSDVEISIGLGGSGGASGSGDTVSITNNASITTKGDGAHGVFAQSIGGGGGNAASGYISNSGSISFGGAGGNAGNGGDVTVINNGNITTEGYGAYGIFAQSIGGGGGNAGDTTLGIDVYGLDTLTNPLGGNGGDGGDVTVISEGTIHLKGDGCVGILAQSVGGGGGLIGSEVGLGFLGSLGGTGTGGTVTVNHTGDIILEGKNSVAVIAQSYAADGADDMIVTLTGSILGGTELGTGFRFDGGLNNILNTSGLITALSGNAIIGSSGNDTINNTGQLIGNLLMGTGNNALNNAQEAFFQTGDSIDLGGGLFTNSGVVQPGGTSDLFPTDTSVAQVVDLNGSFVQTATGLLQVDMSFNSPTDRIDVTGTADVDGTITPTLLNLTNINPVALITTSGGVTDSGVEVTDTVNVDYRAEVDGNDLNIAITPRFDAAAKNANQASIGRHFNESLTVGGADQLGTTLAWLGNLQDEDTITAAYDSISPEPHLAPAFGALFGGLGFADGLMQREPGSGPSSQFRISGSGLRYGSTFSYTGTSLLADNTSHQNTLDDAADPAGDTRARRSSPNRHQDRLAWIDVYQGTVSHDRTQANFGFSEDMTGFSVGMESEAAPKWRMGWAAGYEGGETEVPQYAKGDGRRISYGIMAKYNQTPKLQFAAALNGGYSRVDMTRFLNAIPQGNAATSDNEIYYLNGRLRAAYTATQKDFYFRPLVNLDATALFLEGFHETGAGGLNIVTDDDTLTVLSVEPVLEIGSSFKITDDLIARLYARGGIRYFSDSDLTLSSRFQGTPSGAGSFDVSSEIGTHLVSFNGGIEIFNGNRFSFGVNYCRTFGDVTQQHSIAGWLSMHF